MMILCFLSHNNNNNNCESNIVPATKVLLTEWPHWLPFVKLLNEKRSSKSHFLLNFKETENQSELKMLFMIYLLKNF